MPDPRPLPEEPQNALVRLVAAEFDPTGLSDDEVVAAAIEARETKKRVEILAAEELAKRNWSWRQIGKALGVDHTTAYGWVRDAKRPDAG